MERGSKGGSDGLHTTPRSAVRQRFDQFAAEVAKFGAVGTAGLLVNLLVFNLVRGTTDLPVVRASVIATVVAICTNYIGFRYFTYRDRDKSGRTKELTLFLLFSAVGLVIENGVLYAATYGFGWTARCRATSSSSSGSASRPCSASGRTAPGCSGRCRRGRRWPARSRSWRRSPTVGRFLGAGISVSGWAERSARARRRRGCRAVPRAPSGLARRSVPPSGLSRRSPRPESGLSRSASAPRCRASRPLRPWRRSSRAFLASAVRLRGASGEEEAEDRRLLLEQFQAARRRPPRGRGRRRGRCPWSCGR